jgi:GNAT superfamily N-acetyltransferase
MLEVVIPKGGDVLPTDRSLDFYMGLFTAVIEGTTPGVVLAAEDHSGVIGGSLVVEVTFPWDSIFGRCGSGFGTVVSSKAQRRGVGGALWDKVLEELRAAGFDHYLGAFHPGNPKILRYLEPKGATVYQCGTRIDL